MNTRIARLPLPAVLGVAILAMALFWGAPAVQAVASRGTAEEAAALVNRAVDLLATTDRDAAFAAFNDPRGSFVDRDLYVFVVGLNGVALAHGSNKGLIGKSVSTVRDPDGKAFVQAILDTAKEKGEGWVDYTWINPETRKAEPKSSYVKRAGDLAICVGIYK